MANVPSKSRLNRRGAIDSDSFVFAHSSSDVVVRFRLDVVTNLAIEIVEATFVFSRHSR